MGGRPAGSKNKITSDLRAQLDQMGCNPIAIMGAIAINEKEETALRLSASRSLARFLHPELKAIEHSGSIKTGTDGGSESSTERILRDLAEETTESPARASGEAHDGAGTSGVSHNLGLPSSAEPETSRNTEGGNPTV